MDSEEQTKEELVSYYADESVTLYCGDAVDVLRALPSESVQTCVTSPPYWGLRQYLPTRSVVLRDDLSEEERQYVEDELQRLDISPQ